MSQLGIDKQLKSFIRGKKSLMRDLADNSKSFFQDTNFNARAFVDVPRKRWSKRKDNKPHPILEKTGKLRNSARARVQSSTRASVEFTAPYASFHNSGTRRLPKRQFSGESRRLNKGNEKIILTYTRSKLL